MRRANPEFHRPIDLSFPFLRGDRALSPSPASPNPRSLSLSRRSPIDRSIQNRNNLINAWAIARNDSLSLHSAPGAALQPPPPSPTRAPLPPAALFIFFRPKGNPIENDD